MFDAELYKRFCELQAMDTCTELELGEWADIGTTIAREEVPKLLDELSLMSIHAEIDKMAIERLTARNKQLQTELDGGSREGY